MALVAQLNDIIMNNDVADANGSLWYMQDLAGWDSPAQRVSSIEIPTLHGEVTVENLYGARFITVTGLCKALSGSLMYQSMYYLMSQTNALVNTVNFRVTEDLERYCAVLRAGEVRTAYIGKGAFSFEINLRADDPFKYAYAATTGSWTGTLNNAGTVRTYPVITLTSSGTPVITVSGVGTWTALSSLPSGTVIDMKRMTVKNGGTSYFDQVAPASVWPYLQPGNNSVSISGVTATYSYRSAWV